MQLLATQRVPTPAGNRLDTIRPVGDGTFCGVTDTREIVRWSVTEECHLLRDDPAPTPTSPLAPTGDSWGKRAIHPVPERNALFVVDSVLDETSDFLSLLLYRFDAPQRATTRQMPMRYAGISDLSPLTHDADRVYLFTGSDVCVAIALDDLHVATSCSLVLGNETPIICDSIHAHSDGRTLSLCKGEFGHGLIQRIALTSSADELTAEVLLEREFRAPADLWACRASPTGLASFGFLLPHGYPAQVNPLEQSVPRFPDLGTVVRVGPQGEVACRSVAAEAIDFRPESLVEAMPSGRVSLLPRQSTGYAAVLLCALDDDHVLFPTPGGRVLEVNFATGIVVERLRLDTEVTALAYDLASGSVALAGANGAIWLAEAAPARCP